MASQTGYFNVQQFTDAGLPLVSGRLYTYAFGTTTQKIAYTDAAGLVAQTYTLDESDVPYIALNSRGELPAPLYLSAGSYDLALKRADGSTVWTRRADGSGLAESSGASLLGFIQAGTGAVARTAEDKMREVISATDYAANGVSGVKVDPTGAVDSTLGIIAALLAAAGKTLVFPPGTYSVDGTLLRVYSGTTIFGYGATLRLIAGTYSTTRYFLGTNTGITYDGAYATSSDISIFGLTIDGNIANVATTDSCYGINAYKTSGFLVQDVNIKNLPGVIGSGYGLAFSFSDDVQARNVNINRTDRQNIIVWETTDAFIDGCTLKDSYFRECILVSSNTPAVYQASSAFVSDSQLNNTMTTGTHVLRISGQVNDCELVNLRISGYNSGAGAGLQGIYVTDVYPKRVTGSNIWIDNCYRGVEVASDAAHIIEFNNLEIGRTTQCYDGFKANTNLSSLKLRGGSISATNIPLYCNAVDYQSIIGLEIIGGSANSSVFSESTGTTVFVGNTVRDNTNASYPLLFAGNGTPIIVGNKSLNNTVAKLRCTTDAVAVGNNAIQVDGVARSGAVVKRSTTLNRPTLGADDIFFPFMDTTLAAAGKPIWWTGTAWVDGTGTVV